MSDAAAPDVSVLIAAYNAESWLRRAVDSAVSQRGVTVEVIVVDDASTDGTLALARDLEADDGRVRAFALAQNGGPSAARNFGLTTARGRYVAILDSDDMMDPDRLATLLATADRGAWDFVADDLYRVDAKQEDGPRRLLLGNTLPEGETITLTRFVEGNLTTFNGSRGELGFLKPIISLDFIKQAGLSYDEEMRLGEDFALYAEALADGARMRLIPPAGYVAFMSEGSLSGKHDTAALEALYRAAERLLARVNLPEDARDALEAHRIDTMKRWYWMRLIDAVKARDLARAARCFAAPVPVVAHLLSQLGEQIVLRSMRLARKALNLESTNKESRYRPHA